MHSPIAISWTFHLNTLNEGFYMRSCSASLLTYKFASPDNDTQIRSHSRIDNSYESTHNYSGPTRCSDFLGSHSAVGCPYPCEHRPYMAANHARDFPHAVHYVHLLQLTEPAENHTNRPDGPDSGDHVDQASVANSDRTTEEVWRPNSRQNSMHNAKEDSIPWAEWIDLPPSLEDSPRQTPLKALPLVAPYRRSGPLHLNNEPIQKHSASMLRQHPELRSGPRRLDLKEALSLIRSTEAQRPAPESTFALCASSKNPYMGHGFPYTDDGFMEFAKSSLSSILELPDQYGAASSRHEPASSIHVSTQIAQQEVVNRSTMWQVNFSASGAFSPSMHTHLQ